MLFRSFEEGENGEGTRVVKGRGPVEEMSIDLSCKHGFGVILISRLRRRE